MIKPGSISYEQYKEHDDSGNAPHLLSDNDKLKLDSGAVQRVGGGCICSICSKEYYDHPPVLGALWCRRLCDNRLVKL